MKKLTLITLLSAITSVPVFAATGDTSQGSVVFTGQVPGFYADGGIIITGLASSTDAAAFKGTLDVNSDGTFASMRNVTLEAHVYTPPVDVTPEVIGALMVADWTVSQVSVIPAAMNEIAENIVVGDALGAIELAKTDYTAGTSLSAANSVELYVRNDVPHSDPYSISGQDISVSVDLVATAP